MFHIYLYIIFYSISYNPDAVKTVPLLKDFLRMKIIFSSLEFIQQSNGILDTVPGARTPQHFQEMSGNSQYAAGGHILASA